MAEMAMRRTTEREERRELRAYRQALRTICYGDTGSYYRSLASYRRPTAVFIGEVA